MTYHVSKTEGLLLFEEYKITLQKGKDKSSRATWKVFGEVSDVLLEIIKTYDDNRRSDGKRALKINLKGKLMDDSELVNMVKEMEAMTNGRNGHNTG